MKIEIKNNGFKDITVITADEGKVLRRIADQQEFGTEVWLGYTYYIGGVKLDEPLFELPEHYEEIDAPIDEQIDEGYEGVTEA